MKILVATDKFKGSLTAAEACVAIREGVHQKFPDAHIILVPLADGGEGTAELLTFHTAGRFVNIIVSGPHFETVDAGYGISGNGTTAFIETAKASGLQLVETANRNPLHTTTYGTGELIRDALRKGCRKVILGIGGTATNDGGIGMAAALGYRFLDKRGKEIRPVGESLEKLEVIDKSSIERSIPESTFVALCDVDNPLHGSHGAAFTYAPQKGANKQEVELLDRGLINYQRVVKSSLGLEADFPGAGAGGGIASGARVFLNANIRAGMDFVMEVTQLENKIREADIIITGEGKIDAQTLHGKVVATVARVSQQMKKKVIAICGVCELRENELHKIGVAEVITLTDPFTSPEQSIKNAAAIIKERLRGIKI